MLVCMRDLRRSDVDILTLGQYLRPSGQPPAGRPILHARRVRRAARARARAWDSRTCRRARSPARRYHAWEQVAAATGGEAAPSPPRRGNRPPDRSRRRADGRHRDTPGHVPPARPRSRPGGRVPRAGCARWCSSAASRRRRARPTASGKIGGFCHLYIGQEAVAVGSLAALRADDYITCSYREHGHALARGISAARRHGRAVRQGRRVQRRQGRLDAPVRRLARLPGRPRHRGRPHPARDRHGLRRQVPRHRPGRGLLLRRGRGQQRRLPRGAQHGRALEAARDLHLREQPLRHGHRARARQRHLRHLRARLLVRHGQRGRWTARTCW